MTVLRVGRPLAVLALMLSLAVSCGGASDNSVGHADVQNGSRVPSGEVSTPACRSSKPTALVPVVERRIPHDSTAYVQGLLIKDGVLYESTGRYGESQLRAMDPETGKVRAKVNLPAEVFGEGLAVGHDGELVQLTWKEGVAYRWPAEQVRNGGEPSGEFAYKGEGWGLTTLDDMTLVMSDGSDRLTVRDPVDFSVAASHTVKRVGGPADQLNELEFDGTWIWANRYQSTEILRIDPECWTVTGVVDATELRDEVALKASEGGDAVDVLNGIAHIPGGELFLVTGKWWPTMFEVTFVDKP